MKIDQPSLFGADTSEVIERAKNTFELLKLLPQDDRIEAINQIRLALHSLSPFVGEPVDCVQWVKADLVQANDYNPNSVAPPEMELLRVSIAADGFTQPIVTFPVDGKREVVDGFHRNRVGKECKDIRERTLGYLPVVAIKQSQSEKGDRIASTIRHNRARGKHKVDAMSDIVVELKRRNWTDERIAKNLGMDQDEILRLMQITGLTELFSDQEFSKSWDVEGEVNESDLNELTDNVDEYGDEIKEFRTVNTSDENRIFHTYDKWECHKAGFYAGSKEGMKKDECEEAYRAFLSDPQKFSNALEHVIDEWKHSCEHYLTNASMNRIAWLGQAAACYALGIPAVFRSGFYLLTEQQQQEANEVALKYLNKWLQANGREAVSMEVAYSGDRQSDIY
jgi:ParB-like chromosome segregation protein Spo0J